jgi:predicted small secreted protein
VSGDLHQTLTAAHNTIEQISETVKERGQRIESVRATIDPNSPTLYELTKSLREVSMAAARSGYWPIRLIATRKRSFSESRRPGATVNRVIKLITALLVAGLSLAGCGSLFLRHNRIHQEFISWLSA